MLQNEHFLGACKAVLAKIVVREDLPIVRQPPTPFRRVARVAVVTGPHLVEHSKRQWERNSGTCFFSPDPLIVDFSPPAVVQASPTYLFSFQISDLLM